MKRGRVLVAGAVVAAATAVSGASPAAAAPTVHPGMILPRGGVISTVAGSSAGFSGDAALADRAMVFSPVAVAPPIASQADGSFLIATAFRIRRVSPTGVITTVAGNGTTGFSGDGGPATRAQLGSALGIAAQPNGAFLIADATNNRIRLVSQDGIITTVAGNGTAGFSGDGGRATAAQLSFPTAVAATFDGWGGFLFVDRGNQRVRRVTPAGIITTVAGNGGAGFSGDGVPATQTQLDNPSGVAPYPDGNILIADTENNRIRRVSPDGIISTVAGGGRFVEGENLPATSVALNRPQGVGTEGGGFLIADTDNSVIRRVTVAGIITTVAGDHGTSGYLGDHGPATSAQLSVPAGVAAVPGGGVLIADTNNQVVRRVDTGGTITTVAGRGLFALGDGGEGAPAPQARLQAPAAVTALPDGSYLIADTGNNRIRQVTPDGVILTAVGTSAGLSGDGGPAASAQLNAPMSVTALPDGNLLIADTGNHRIRRVTPNP